MRRKALVAVVVGLAVPLFLLAPVVTVVTFHSWETLCPPGNGGLRSVGDGALDSHGFGSPSYALLGFGGVWRLGHYGILKNGCGLADNGQVRVCTGQLQ
jgi:hypothetical protein